MDFIQKIIVRIGLPIMIFLAIYAHFLIPKYPKIEHNQPYQFVFEDVTKQIISNTQHINFDSMNDQKSKQKYKESIEKFKKNLEICSKNEDSQCLVSSYEDFMDDNVAPSNRMYYKAQYIHDHYGRLGDIIITDNYKWLY